MEYYIIYFNLFNYYYFGVYIGMKVVVYINYVQRSYSIFTIS